MESDKGLGVKAAESADDVEALFGINVRKLIREADGFDESSGDSFIGLSTMLLSFSWLDTVMCIGVFLRSAATLR